MKRLCFLLLLVPGLLRAQSLPVYFGADLSYVNEMEDCGGVYRENGQPRDPFDLFAERGTNLARVRLWHDAGWTAYSDFADARETIRRAKAAGMGVLLDFHYSDDWADPGRQEVPAAWTGLDVATLQDSLYQYTFDVLSALAAEDLLPEMVQVGNEINPGFLLPSGSTGDWAQLGGLLNAAIRAVRDVEAQADHPVKVMLHVAQPENVHAWIADALNEGGVTDFDVIGLSYYKNWSYIPLDHLPDYIDRLVTAYGREVVVVETAYVWTLGGNDGANNILGGTDALEPGYAATPEDQRRYLVDLTQAVLDGGGSGIVIVHALQ
jgi:arabinogalactan endo-1,4-beta-galactosidase